MAVMQAYILDDGAVVKATALLVFNMYIERNRRKQNGCMDDRDRKYID